MKKIILSLCLLAASASMFAAGAQYENMMSGLLTKMRDAKSAEALVSVQNGFLRVAEAETKEWLPLYYAAYCNVVQAYMTQDGAIIDEKLDAADSYLLKASLVSENDEIMCLQSWSKSARIMVNPMTRGAKYGPEAGALLDKALKLNPNNPRAYFLKGQSAYYTPEAFGGSKKKAKEYFTQANDLYNSKQATSNLAPTWGKEETAKVLAELSK